MLFTKDIGLASPKYKGHRTTEREASEEEQLASGIFNNDSHKPLEFPPSVYEATMILADKLQEALDPFWFSCSSMQHLCMYRWA